MTTILLFIQVFIVIGLIGVILLQKTGSDSLAGLSGSGNGLLSSKSTANVFSKVTIYLAVAFIANSLLIAKIEKDNFLKSTRSIIDNIIVSPEQDLNKEQEAPKIEE